jgi:hypothetical protein
MNDMQGVNYHGNISTNLDPSVTTVENTSVAAPETFHHDDTTTFEEYHIPVSGESSETSNSTATEDVESLSRGTNYNSSNEKDRRRNVRMSIRKKSSRRLNVEELVEASKGHMKQEECPKRIWETDFAVRLYIVVAVSICLRTFWILQGISILILLRITRLLVVWFLYIAGAKEIREFRDLAKWWFNFGLKFSTKTIEGDRFHRLLTSFTLNFWSNIGIKYSLNLYKDIAMEQRQKFLLQAKENLNRAQKPSLKMKNILQLQQGRSG